MDKLPDRPEFGKPCNGCGQCCYTERCKLAILVVEEVDGPCPLMTYQDGKIRCTLVLAEKDFKLSPFATTALGIGKGCDSFSVRNIQTHKEIK